MCWDDLQMSLFEISFKTHSTSIFCMKTCLFYVFMFHISLHRISMNTKCNKVIKKILFWLIYHNYSKYRKIWLWTFYGKIILIVCITEAQKHSINQIYIFMIKTNLVFTQKHFNWTKLLENYWFLSKTLHWIP